MICVSIYQESRRLALVDMLNAAGQADLLEVRLDRFGKAPDIGELLAARPKPVIMSCRRPSDGGAWDGRENERIALLRQCIVSKADYVEIEHDIADQIRPFPPAKRVISYTNLRETPSDLQEIYDGIRHRHADVIKLVLPVRTPEETWPVLQLVQKTTVPTVVVGLGKPGVMLAILGRKLGAPWVYAALEKGMEAYPGQVSVRELVTVYRYRDIGRETRFVGITGFSDLEAALTAGLNEALARVPSALRCLPLPVGDERLFRKVMDAFRLHALWVDQEHQAALYTCVARADKAAQFAAAADFLVRAPDRSWHGYHLLSDAVCRVLQQGPASQQTLSGRIVVVVGTGPLGKALVYRLKQVGALPIVAGRQRDILQEIAQNAGCRYLLAEAIYSTMHDVLIVAEAHAEARKAGEAPLHPGFLKPGMTVLDLSALPRDTAFMDEARQRGCTVCSPRAVVAALVERAATILSGRSPASESVEAALREALGDE
ncbi:MAG: hypothetical protein C4297_12810 [Gemmataceae bacterium]